VDSVESDLIYLLMAKTKTYGVDKELYVIIFTNNAIFVFRPPEIVLNIMLITFDDR